MNWHGHEPLERYGSESVRQVKALSHRLISE